MRSKLDIREILQKNAVTVMFVVLCIIGLICSGQTVSYVMYELFGRLSEMHLSYWHLLFLSLPVWVSTLLLPLVPWQLRSQLCG